MANKITRFPRSVRNQAEEPTEMAIFGLGDMRVVMNLEDGTVRSQDVAEVISIQKKPKFRRARTRKSLNKHSS
jgi:hypothetical protein